MNVYQSKITEEHFTDKFQYFILQQEIVWTLSQVELTLCFV
jgi:hypothetical protein